LKGNAVRIIAAPGCQGRRAGKGLAARADTLLAESDGVNDISKSENQNESERNGMHMIWKILKAEVPLLVLTVCTITSGVLVTLGFPLALGDLFDVVRNHLENNSGALFMEQKSMWEIGLGGYASLVKQAWQSAPPDFYPVLFRLSACLVLSAIGNAGSSFLAPTVGERVGRQLRKNTMEALMQKNQQFFDSHTAGEIMSRLNPDCTAVQTTLVEFLGQRGLRSVLEIFFSLVVM
jgi:ABC-type multidrug transport system fused ATPase/permease subunit